MNKNMCPLERAKWIGARESAQSPILIRRFLADKIKKATLFVTGLGYFEAKINGNCVGTERLIPVVSDYEKRPLEQFLYPLFDDTTHAIYYYEYDVTALLNEGENEVTLQLGNGFYRQLERNVEGPVHFGTALKAIYALYIENDSEAICLVSDGSETWKDSEITYNNIYIGEIINPLEIASKEQAVEIYDAPDSELRKAIGVPDCVIRTIVPRVLGKVGTKTIFDAGENISGVVRISTKAPKGEIIQLRFAEQVNKDLTLYFDSTGADYKCSSGRMQIQEDIFVADGTEREFEPKFVWHTFRYFEVVGDFERAEVLVIHSDVPVTARFESSSEGLNFLWDAYLRTQLNNMHGSIPSDCPHRERLGYTGDGQICAPTAMMVLDSREFYKKWIQDILDCQDKVSGHVQHTAPLMGGGGGPGGWGCAVVMVPYAYYKQFGDLEMVANCYEPMQRWLQYLLEHCEDGLVMREEKDGWCLGDWLTLEKTILPEPYVNTCYLAKSLRLMAEMAVAMQRKEDADAYLNLAKETVSSIKMIYRNPQTGHYCDGVQGADAYAVWAGLVNDDEIDEHVKALADKYDTMGYFDTGFLGTDILAEVLMDYGYADVVLKLLESDKLGSFLYMKQRGATTIWEDWKGKFSLCHPMFGGVARQLFTGFLGIRQTKNSYGYDCVEINPRIPTQLISVSGSIVTPKGEISVSWKKSGEEIVYDVNVADGITVC